MDSAINNALVCKHCEMILPNFDVVPSHGCFLKKEVYMDSNNVLYTPDAISEEEELTVSNYILESVLTAEDDASVNNPSMCIQQNVNIKQAAVWSTQATLALLSLYDANKHLVDNPKKQGKLWTVISDGLFQTWGIEMTKDQVRWKMNALIQKYHECLDNNSKSGRGAMPFKWLQQMEEIFHRHRDAAAGCTVSSGFASFKRKADATGEKAPKKGNKTDTTKKFGKENSLAKLIPQYKASSCEKSLHEVNSAENKQIQNSSPLASNSSETRTRPTHGTGSKVARTKIELEKQWLSHLANKEKRDSVRDARYERMMEKKKEALQLKKRQLAIKEKECEVRKQIAEKKIQQQAKKHDETMELEKIKCQLMKDYLKGKVNKSPTVLSDSDDD